MLQVDFAHNAQKITEPDESVICLAVGGSWIESRIDEFSDLDLILVTKTKISDNREQMMAYASRFGELLSAFTGEHVGEPRLLVCLYDNPLLHVDIKFLTPSEFYERVENPVILFNKSPEIKEILKKSEAKFPFPDYQWIEDRFWIWVHYILLKIGRGEYFEAFDSLSFVRNIVLGPLLHIQNGNLPRGVRHVESDLKKEDLEALKTTIPVYERESLLKSLKNSIVIYQKVKNQLFTADIQHRKKTQERVMAYFDEISRC